VLKVPGPQRFLPIILLAAVALDGLLWWPTAPDKRVGNDGYPQSMLGVPFSMEVTQPLPQYKILDLQKVALGRALFDERKLSANNSIACSSCHVLSSGGIDNRVYPVGINGAEGNINTLTVFNSSFNFVLNWDGRATTQEEQIEDAVNDPRQLGSNWTQVLEKLNREESYRNRFARLYADDITANNIKDAIATFERSLVTPNSRFDQFLRGDRNALTPVEQTGYRKFREYGCVSCHQGVNLGGNLFERMGVFGDYFKDRGNETDVDLGRFNVTKSPADRHFFRVPSLRNVAKTAPYFHDGSVKNLPDAVRIMAQYQLGRSMPEDDLVGIVSFLYTLTGVYEGRGL
jgi:cytochrome c peroxidase